MAFRKTNSRGLGLIEVMIAMVVGLLVIAGTVSMAKVSRRQQITISNTFDFDNLKRNIQRLVSSSGTCRGLFFEANGSSALQFVAGQDNQVKLQLGTVVLAEANMSLGSGLTITSVVLQQVPGSALDATTVPGSTIARVQLVLTAQRNADSVGPSQVSNDDNPFIFSIQVNDTSRLIESCADGAVDPVGMPGSVSCKSGGSFGFKDIGWDNDFGFTCRGDVVTSICANDDVDRIAGGWNPSIFLCEAHLPVIPGRIGCTGAANGTRNYGGYPTGGLHNVAFTCRDGKLSGWCSPARAASVSGTYHCENSIPPDPMDPDRIVCDGDGTYLYEDEVYAQFAVSCRAGRLTGICFGERIAGLQYGLNPGYQCEN